MKHNPFSLLATALVAGCLSAGAWAADAAKSGDSSMPAAGTSAMPDAQQGTQPSAKNLDANAQRAHSRSRGTEPGTADAAKSKGMSGSSTDQVAQGGTRDWSQVDTNHDNSVSPDEMQKYLDQHSSGNKASKSSDTSATPAPKQ